MGMVLLSGGVAVVGLLFALYLVSTVLKKDQGSQRIKDIVAAIEEGALAFLNREYRTLAVFVVVVAVALAIFIEWRASIAYVVGAIASAGAGYAGMRMGVKANGRTAAAATKGLNQALRVAFSSGGVMGTIVVAFGLLGLCLIYVIFRGPELPDIIVGFSFGASTIALFARVGGGIYTKGADVGADLVGKVEAGIPEDDPRNPAVIADNVGDNVGDIAGMGADLFESYSAAIVATFVVAVAAGFAFDSNKAVLPFVIAGGGIIAAIIGTFFVRVGELVKMEALLMALRKGIWVASVLVAVISFFLIRAMDLEIGIFWAVLSGLVAGILIGLSVEYYTSYTYRPTQDIAESALTGTGTLIIKGFGTAMVSTLFPVLLVIVATLVSYHYAGLYGIAIASLGMLSTLGITLATDAYGPVADNAGGIAEQAHLPKEVRERTDALDSLGNTTAATGKGFAIGSAALAALGLTAAFGERMKLLTGEALSMSLLDPIVLAGLLIGAVIVFVFCALTLSAVGKAAFEIVNEVRRQWREVKGLMTGEARPDYARVVDICTKSALKQMLLPGILAVGTPVLVGLVLGPDALGGMLIGAIASGFMVAVTMANAGGAWDNAKKYIESGKFGGKGSEAHKASVVGDTVGDPFKDTSGPSLNILLKLMSIVAVVFAPLFVNGGLF